jgi:hypothetical protein
LVDRRRELLFMGAGGTFFIGPGEERWDRAMLVRQASVESFIAFASKRWLPDGAIGHRTAALEDSRLLRSPTALSTPTAIIAPDASPLAG